jgi:hypothetical protein
MTIRESSPDVNTPNPQGGFNSFFLRSLTNNNPNQKSPLGDLGVGSSSGELIQIETSAKCNLQYLSILG